jgi:putative ABC transport system substrate-binding protein
MRRRDFITLVGGSAATAWSLAARAATDVPVIGFLSVGSLEADAKRLNGVRRGLTEIGYVEGQNLATEYRGAQYQYDQLPTLARDLINRKVRVIVTIGTSAALAAKEGTDTIPIVFGIVTNLIICASCWLAWRVMPAVLTPLSRQYSQGSLHGMNFK